MYFPPKNYKSNTKSYKIPLYIQCRLLAVKRNFRSIFALLLISKESEPYLTCPSTPLQLLWDFIHSSLLPGSCISLSHLEFADDRRREITSRPSSASGLNSCRCKSAKVLLAFGTVIAVGKCTVKSFYKRDFNEI